jgi:glutathione peroxidase
VTFPVFSKIDVKGEHAHPLFTWLTANLDSVLGREIKWNFTKFLIGRDGAPLDRFLPLKPPRRLRGVVASALGVAT